MRLTVLLLSLALGALALPETRADDEAVLGILRGLAIPIASPDDLGPLYERAKDSRYVFLGEASHGTSEFYTWRAAISKRLVADHGFSFIAVEGDYEACQRLNRYVKDLPGAGESARDVLMTLDRWPRWMWANEEVVELAEWLRKFNAGRPGDSRVGIFGIDLYGAGDSYRALMDYLEASDAEASGEVSRMLEPFGTFAGDMNLYAQSLARGGDPMNEEIERAVELMRRDAGTFSENDPKSFFNAKQHALVIKRAERHYRAMHDGGAASWNARADHFYDTIERLMRLHGPDARAVVWAHNTHIGDARATDMALRSRRNIGQLVRESHGEDAALLVGFGTHRGRVLAGASWGSPMQRMDVPGGQEGSLEDLFNRLGHGQALALFRPSHSEGPLAEVRGHRAIGVTYDPRRERLGNYVPTILPRRYDAFIFIDETDALEPLHR